MLQTSIYQIMYLPQRKLNRLKGKKHIEHLFFNGKKISKYPLSVIILEHDITSFGVSVGKRHFKLAVNRNKIKRLLREISRQHLLPVFQETGRNFSIMLLYNSNTMPTLASLEKTVKILIEKIKETL